MMQNLCHVEGNNNSSVMFETQPSQMDIHSIQCNAYENHNLSTNPYVSGPLYNFLHIHVKNENDPWCVLTPISLLLIGQN